MSDRPILSGFSASCGAFPRGAAHTENGRAVMITELMCKQVTAPLSFNPIAMKAEQKS